MGDSATGTAVPAAVSKRSRLVKLPSGIELTVLKWSFTRALEVMEFVDGQLKNVPKELTDKIFKGSAFSMAMATMQLLGGQMLGVVRLSVEKDQRHLVTGEMDVDDVMTLVDAVLEMNMTETLTKKTLALWKRFERMFMGAK